MERPKTIICDLDGTVWKHAADMAKFHGEMELLPGVLEKFREWIAKDYKIILMTGRKESMREVTIKQLSSFGLSWDHLIMNCGGGYRYLINDLKPNSDIPTAYAITLARNEGMEKVNI